MYTAIIKSKEFTNGILKVTVEFTDGVTTLTETCIPQDFNGLKFWVKSRLATLNGGQEIDSTLAVNDTIDVTDPVVMPPTPTQEETERTEWLKDYAKWVRVKTTLIDTGVFTGNEAPAMALKAKVTTGFKTDYLNFI